jgi:hypothetical protein
LVSSITDFQPTAKAVVLEFLGEFLRLDFLRSIFEKLTTGGTGALTFVEDMPESKKHLNYAALNLQSMRIINRLIQHLKDHKTTESIVLKEIIIQQNVRAKNKTESVSIMKSDAFFARLKALGIVKKADVKKNLCMFLCIDENYLSSLMFKKLQRTLKDFKASMSLTLVGCKKLNLPEEDQYEYYDEDEPKNNNTPSVK